jgi:hypothetical protein
MVFGMICSVLGPIITVLGTAIDWTGKAQLKWIALTKMNTASLLQLKMAVISTVLSLATIGVILYGLSQMSAASAASMSKDWDKLSSSATKMEWTITDANGNLMYSINTLTGEVSDSKGQIIGSYDAMSGTLIAKNNDLIGSIDDTGTHFTDFNTGAIGTVNKGISDLAEAFKGFDTSGMQTGLDGMTNSLNGMNTIMTFMAAVSIVNLIARLAELAVASGITMGVLGTLPTGAVIMPPAGAVGPTGLEAPAAIAGTSVAAWLAAHGITAAAAGAVAGAVAPPVALVLGLKVAQNVIEANMTEQQKFVQKRAEELNKQLHIPMPGKTYWPGGQFGLQRVPKTGLYKLEKGEKVTATRKYGPVEETERAPVEEETTIEESFTTFVKRYMEVQETQKKFVQNMEEVSRQFTVILPRGQFGIPRVPKAERYWLEKGETIEPVGEYGSPEEGIVATAKIPVPQVISVYNNFESVTLASGLDVEAFTDMVADKTNRKIAEGIRRKRP